MRSIYSQAGYLKSDDRNSGGVLIEDDVIGCGHCHGVILKSKLLIAHAHCHGCDKPICSTCGIRAERDGCVPHDKWLSRAMAEAYRREQNAKILGI